MRVTTRNANFQQWQALLTNRGKRQRNGEFLVQGVRPISLAISHGFHVRYLLFQAGARLSDWAGEVLDSVDAPHVAVAAELLRELSEKDDSAPELLAVVGLPPDDLERIGHRPDLLGVVFDRPASPGNLGTLVRSADAFGAHGLLVCGHGADPYDPKAVRASTGSLFAVPVVRVARPDTIVDWCAGRGVRLIGTDESAAADIADCDLTTPSLLVIGNETTGLSRTWRESVDTMASIPITGSSSSLNAATAASIALYEAARQRARAASRSRAGQAAR